MLILADDAAQTRPLLPPDGCALIITSRTHIELEGMVTSNLDMLKSDDAIALLHSIAPRIGDAAADLAKLCGYLPLALRVSATFLKRCPAAPIADYLTKLRDERARLSHLRELSYAVLPDVVQQAFQQISVFVGSFTLAAAEAVVQVAGSSAGDLLDELYLSSLLNYDEATARYTQHDLLRDYGRTRLSTHRYPHRYPRPAHLRPRH